MGEEEEWMREERMGLRRQVGVEERAVAVIRMSGWRIRRGEVGWEVSFIVGSGEEEEDVLAEVGVVKLPMMFISSPGRRSEYAGVKMGNKNIRLTGSDVRVEPGVLEDDAAVLGGVMHGHDEFLSTYVRR